MSDGLKRKAEDFQRKLEALQEKIGSVANTNSDAEKEIRREMELLANEFGFTVWYEARIDEVWDDRYPYTDIRWDVFIPNNFNKEILEETELLFSGLRHFMFGESRGNEQGCWISSYSC
jgi:hypothetical protein